MADHEKLRDVRIFFGPDFAGKNTLYKRELSNSHVCVRPSDIYQKNPTYGFRDVCFQIVALLKEGWSVAIVDNNECKKTRMSYVKLLQKKCSDISFTGVSVLPLYGCDQLFWTRELRLAEESCYITDNSTSNINVCDSKTQKWFSGESNTEVSYQTGIVEAMSENEGFKIINKVVGIYTRSMFKFEVPALFIQWELLYKYCSSSGLYKICQLWRDVNVCGRIIIICDGYTILTGEMKRNQQVKEIDEVMKTFTSKFTVCPVYVFHVSEPKIAGSYIIPPKPGILAFLQQRHCLNLASKRTLYLYETTVHMKMAEAASVRHIKGTRLIENPDLVLSNHTACIPSQQEMLQTMKVLPYKTDSNIVCIPLYNRMFSDGKIQQQFSHGRSEYVYVQDSNILDRYNNCYIEKATRVGEPGSKISQKNSSKSLKHCKRDPAESINVSNRSLDSSSRGLPKWMIKKESKTSSASIERTNSSESTGGSKVRKTVYIMTDKELMDIACDILKQGGKADLVDRLWCKKETKGSQWKEKHTQVDPIDNNTSLLTKKICNAEKANVCPKLEHEAENCDSDLYDNNEDSVDGQEHDVNHSSDSTDLDNDDNVESTCLNDKSIKCDSVTNVDKVVADVLDDLSSTNVAPKLSPRKRARRENEDILSPSKRRALHSNKKSEQKQCEPTVMETIYLDKQPTKISEGSKKKQRFHLHKNSPDLTYLEDIF
ncbi:hypothetical protein ACF0H5_008685 [Mactra antiquata]